MMRIGMAGISIEACSFSTLPTVGEDFLIQTGEKLLSRVSNICSNANVALVPLLRAQAIPGGTVQQDAYNPIKSKILALVRAKGPWDGLYLDMHGAMHVQGLEDAEGDFFTALRETVGSRCILGASYDLHGNISKTVFDNIDFISAYRTAPHIDTKQTRDRTLRFVIECIAHTIVPRKAWIPLPIILPGEVTSTEWEPGNRIYESIPHVSAAQGVMDASILMGFPWVDEPRAGASILTYGREAAKVKDTAITLAKQVWAARKDFRFGVPAFSATSCIEKAMMESHGPVFVSDSGDNPTAGGAGDTTEVLSVMLDCGIKNSVFASIADAKATIAAFEAGAGAPVTLCLGGKIDPVNSETVTVSGTIMAVHTAYDAAGRINRQAVVQAKRVRIIITEQRTPFHTLKQFSDLGIDVHACAVVAVKMGYLVPELKNAACKAYLALSKGAVDQRITELDYHKIKRPIYPLEPDMDIQLSDRLVSNCT